MADSEIQIGQRTPLLAMGAAFLWLEMVGGRSVGGPVGRRAGGARAK